MLRRERWAAHGHRRADLLRQLLAMLDRHLVLRGEVKLIVSILVDEVRVLAEGGRLQDGQDGRSHTWTLPHGETCDGAVQGECRLESEHGSRSMHSTSKRHFRRNEMIDD